jgi:DNA-binding IclR family transcriptional regulator
VPYETIERAPTEVLNALRREGGELSYSDLILATKLPYDVIVAVVEHLEEKGRVRTDKESVSEIDLVYLP